MSIRRWVVRVGAALAVAAAGVAGLAVWTFSGMGSIEDGAVLEGGARVVRDGYVSAFLVPLADGRFALVDAGNDAAGTAVLAALAAAGAGPEDVAAVLLTHAHPDHVAACALFPDATTWVSHAELPVARGEEPVHGPLTRWFPPSASGCPHLTGVDDGATFEVGGTSVTAWAVPGHTAGSTAWRVGPVLFLGDSADATAAGELVAAKWIFTDDAAENVAALQQLARRARDPEVHVVAFAHSGTLPAERLWAWGD
jgi:glyoxylase-like metal-dependent hydrolase (beta-lactamase superfamily II)